jgi:hypothetical protein
MINIEHVLPSRAQTLLLRAAVLKPESASECFESWRRLVDIQNIDRGSIRLLPMVYRNLAGEGITGVEMNKARGCNRMSWYKNNIILAKAAEVMALLSARGVKCLPMKGLAMCLSHYADAGVRPMDDFDLLVAPEQALAALDCLFENGWRPLNPLPSRMKKSDLLLCRYEVPLVDGYGQRLDLHWSAPAPAANHKSAGRFWDGCGTATWRGLQVSLPASESHFLITCVHGVRWSSLSPIRWLTDAYTIITSEKNYNWRKVVDLAEELALIGHLAAALQVFDFVYPGALPEDFLSTVQKKPVAALEQRELRLFLRPVCLRRRLLLAYLRALRRRIVYNQRSNPELPDVPPPFGTFLVHYSQKRSVGEVLWHGFLGLLAHPFSRT